MGDNEKREPEMKLGRKSSRGENENVIAVVHRSCCQIIVPLPLLCDVTRRLNKAQNIFNGSIAGRPTAIEFRLECRAAQRQLRGALHTAQATLRILAVLVPFIV